MANEILNEENLIKNKIQSEINQQEKNSNPKLPPIRTLKTDTSEFVKDRNISVVDVIVAEEKRRVSDTKTIEAPEHNKKKLILIITISAFVLIALSAVFLLLPKKSDVPKKIELKIPPALIYSENTDSLILKIGTEEKIEKLLVAKTKNPYTKNLFIYIPIIKQGDLKDEIISSKNFLDLLKIRGADDFIGAINNDFNYGIISLDRNYPVMIFKLDSYERAFSGILKWENKIYQDISILFGLPSLDINYLMTAKFNDKVILNRDVRELKDEAGVPLIVYSFLDRQTLVITTKYEAIKEIFRRFTLPQ